MGQLVIGEVVGLDKTIAIRFGRADETGLGSLRLMCYSVEDLEWLIIRMRPIRVFQKFAKFSENCGNLWLVPLNTYDATLRSRRECTSQRGFNAQQL